MAALFQFETRTAPTIRQDALITVRFGLQQNGVPDPDVSPLSDTYVTFTAFANEAEIAEANAVVSVDQVMPDTATGANLERWGIPSGIRKRSAGGSAGPVILDTSAPTDVVTGAELKDNLGQRFKVSIGGIYANGDLIPIEAVTKGSATNLPAGTSLQWVSAPTFSNNNAIVGTGGLRNGVDTEGDETCRSRLFEHWRNPPASGNAQYVVEIAESDDLPMVQKGYVYAAVQGPSTTHIAVTAAPTATNKNRDVAASSMATKVGPYIIGQQPGRSFYIVTTVANQASSVAIGLALPAATTASPPGPGGGWLDGSPWPLAGTGARGCRVTTVTSTLQFTVDATTAPVVAVSQISWLSPTDWKLYSALVTAVTGSAGAFVITIDQPFVNIAVGCQIWPSCENAQVYVDALLAFYAKMGPGEKTSNVSALVRGYRHPRPRSSWPSSLGPTMLSSLKNNATDITDAQFISRHDGTTNTTGNGGEVFPSVPVDVKNPPSQFVPQHVGFYAL
jgi:uncharacterized phage protein gp47/JayE